MKKNIWTIVLLFMAALTAHAQTVITKEPADVPDDGKTHEMIIYLKSGATINYVNDNLHHVTYLPGIGLKVYENNSTTSVDYLFSQMTKIEYLEDANANANKRQISLDDYPEAWRLEYPQVNSNLSPTKDGAEMKSQIIVKKTDDYGITYSAEWDNDKVANRWTCYQLHEGNTQSLTGRNDDYKEDPDVAVSATLDDYKNSGFTRGALCPSTDRLCTKEQNRQTFFLTNTQPQWQKHKNGLWKNLEDLVRNYATNDSYTASHCDTLYVVKAATITDRVKIDNEIKEGVYNEKCNDRLLVPKYFYIALLHYNKATDTYHAIAFWTLHEEVNDTNKNFSRYAISINELEERTGIDFFCNLPDFIEKRVEAELDLDFWKLADK